MTLSPQRISRDPRRFHVEEFPIRFTDAMGMKFSVPFRIFAVYDVGSRLIRAVMGVIYVVFAAHYQIDQTSLP
jgi:hypothetical protein